MNGKTYSELKKLCRGPAQGLPSHRMALLGDCATQHLAVMLRGAARARGVELELWEADYDQLQAQILDDGSEMYAHNPGTVLLFLCAEKLYDRFVSCPVERRADFARQECARITGWWDRIAAVCPAQILQYNFVELDDRVFGDYAAKNEAAFITQLRQLNELVRQAAAARKQVALLDLQRVQNLMGRRAFYDAALYYVAKMPIALQALPEVAELAVDRVCVTMGRVKKCAVLDLDNTLWGGVIGDDGINGIQLGELGQGRAFTDLQRWLLELRRRGVLLAVCSKNEKEAAMEPFLHHPEMVLRMEDIALFVANWEDKASNIRYIQKTLNIGMDSLVFIDDNPFERQAVRALLPEVCVPELPEDPAHYLEYLRGLDLFSTASYSESDAVRTQQYREESSRAEAQQQFGSYEEYLESLEMQAAAAPFDGFHIPRIAQLTQRSNQFNLRTVRYTEDAAAAAAADPDTITQYFTLEDKFGDYGLVGVVILRKTGPEEAFVDTWLMSCRVLRRGMEELIADRIVALAKQAGCKRVVGEYLPTAKNKMVSELYPRMGFEPVGENRWQAAVDTYTPHKTKIKEKSV